MTEPTDPADAAAGDVSADSGVDDVVAAESSEDSADAPVDDSADADSAVAADGADVHGDGGEDDASADEALSALPNNGRHRATIRDPRNETKKASEKSAGAKTSSEEVAATGVKGFLLRFEMPLLIALAIAIAIILKSFVIQPFYIPSESMEQTLHGCSTCSGDRILVFKPVYSFRDPHPGDIVVFKAPPDWEEAGGTVAASNPLARGVQWFGQLVGVIPPSEKDLVKRVVAIGGQTVKCCDPQGNVQVSSLGVDGPWTSLNEPYIYQPQSYAPPLANGQRAPNDARSFGPVTVPNGRLWVLGDHRSDSADSRYHCGAGGSGSACDAQSATVPVDDVIGKAVVIAWPPSRWRTLGTPKTFKTLAMSAVTFPATQPAAAGGLTVLTTGLVVRRLRRRKHVPRHHRT